MAPNRNDARAPSRRPHHAAAPAAPVRGRGGRSGEGASVFSSVLITVAPPPVRRPGVGDGVGAWVAGTRSGPRRGAKMYNSRSPAPLPVAPLEGTRAAVVRKCITPDRLPHFAAP